MHVAVGARNAPCDIFAALPKNNPDVPPHPGYFLLLV